MRADRLTVLAEHLEQLEEKLNMNVWRCGTAACAMGQACLIPAFQEAGLRICPDDPEDPSRGTPGFQDEEGRWYFGFDAADSFFECSSFTTKWLFSPGKYAGDIENLDAKVVAARIRALLARED